MMKKIVLSSLVVMSGLVLMGCNIHTSYDLENSVSTGIIMSTGTIQKAEKVELTADDIHLKNMGIMDRKGMYHELGLDTIFDRKIPDDAQCRSACKIYHRDGQYAMYEKAKECTHYWVEIPKYGIKYWTSSRRGVQVLDTGDIISDGGFFFGNEYSDEAGKGTSELYVLPQGQDFLTTLQATWPTIVLDNGQSADTCFEEFSPNIFAKQSDDYDDHVLVQSGSMLYDRDKVFDGEYITWYGALGQKLNAQNEKLKIYKGGFTLGDDFCHMKYYYIQLTPTLFIKVPTTLDYSMEWPLCPSRVIDLIE